ncbi:EcsC family protein [Pseudooceanicola sp. CBS1P-1]|uniref:Protein EcsC n=1 Tax=Pseudooceanicola albus TaxID=2692189 RepID=A0A6L7G181_9RHOB|nr:MULTISPECIES: EcsC family protein [Pseudooceanicola]MBT9382677.1 EcsC family protein [Pseudooceanicola endophyticus]MXN17216.1 protein EcsC [Pseudooceanicola albus]
MAEIDIRVFPPARITPLTDTEVAAEIAALATRYREASGAGIRVLNMLGNRAEGLLERLPPKVRNRLGQATEQALLSAVRAAERSRDMVKDQPGWVDRVVTTGLGAAGGLGGLPSALAELPVTTTMLLRSVQGVAAEYGFDPKAANVQFDSIQVLAAAGPLSGDDGADTGFLTARMTLTGPALNAMLGSVAPKLAAALGRKLATQMVPLLGAAAGAATNFAYARYYREMAHVQFGLRRLAIDAGQPHEDLVDALRAELTRQPRVEG